MPVTGNQDQATTLVTSGNKTCTGFGPNTVADDGRASGIEKDGGL
jgi:hypothetical protein